MTLRSHTIEKKKDTHKQIWEWEETPELLAAIEQLHKSSQAVEDIKVPNLFASRNSPPSKKKNGKSVQRDDGDAGASPKKNRNA